MTIVDLAEARRRRETNGAIAAEVALGVADEFTAMAIRYADRAFVVAGPIAATDLEVARTIYSGMRVRLLRRVKREVPKELLPLALEWVRRVYRSRLIEQIDERNGRNGGAA